jgi:hypothetical protein
MLLNHPSYKWPNTKRLADLDQYDKIRDLPFPEIPPAADTDVVRQVVEEYKGPIRKLVAEVPGLALHLLGS